MFLGLRNDSRFHEDNIIMGRELLILWLKFRTKSNCYKLLIQTKIQQRNHTQQTELEYRFLTEIVGALLNLKKNY